MRPRAALALAATAVLLALTVSAAPAVARTAEGRMQKIARTEINALRSHSGLRPLARSRALERSASRYARFMLSHGYFGHLSQIRGPRRFRPLAEVILLHRGRHGQPRTAVRNWGRSAGHRYVILGAKYRRIGIGKASGRFQGRRVTIWVSHLGTRKSRR